MSSQVPNLSILKSFADKLEKSANWLFLGFTVLYSATIYVLSKRKLMWNDELFTYYIARLPTMTDVWGALMSGGEQQTPFFYLVTRASINLFGESTLAFRLPEVIGFWIMCLCLFIFVSRRTSKLFGLLAAFFPLITFAFFYAYDARPYGLVVGFAGLALLCWQSALMNRWRLLSIIFLALSLAGAVSTHYYGVFVIFPLALGEIFRTIKMRRLDLPVWVTFFLALTPLFLFLPLIQKASSYSTNFWWKPSWIQIPDSYFTLLYSAILPILCLLFLIGIYQSVFAHGEADLNTNLTQKLKLPIYEILAAIGFILIPIICVIVGKFVTGAFADRYALSTIIGLSILVSFVCAKLTNNSTSIATLLLICFGGWFGILIIKDFWKPGEVWGAYPQTKIQLIQNKGDDNLPIVAADPYTFIELERYGPPEIKSRVVYLADPEASLKHLKHNSVERGMVDLLGPWFGLKVMNYQSYMATRPRFLLCGDPEFYSWIVPQLEEEKMNFELKGFKGKILLLLVTQPEPEIAQSR